jgi:hypothetical protein
VVPALAVDAQGEPQMGMSILVAADSAAGVAVSLVGRRLRPPVAEQWGFYGSDGEAGKTVWALCAQ